MPKLQGLTEAQGIILPRNTILPPSLSPLPSRQASWCKYNKQGLPGKAAYNF